MSTHHPSVFPHPGCILFTRLCLAVSSLKTDRNSHGNTMDEDMNIPSSTMEFVEQFTTSDDNTVYTMAAPSTSMPVESQVVEVAETPGVLTENDRMETENKNGSTSNYPSSADDAASIVGPCDNLVNASDCSRDSKAVGNKMVVQ
ncbi:hypothetical protein PS1_026110 [Malus domestica]